MTRTLNLNGWMMMITMIMKVMNATLKIAIDTVELLNEMILIIKTEKNKSTVTRLLLIVLMMKLFDLMIGNTVSFCIDTVRIITKIVNVTELVETVEFIILFITMLIMNITCVIRSNFVGTGSTSVMLMIVSIMLARVVVALTVCSETKLNAGRRGTIHPNDEFQTSYTFC